MAKYIVIASSVSFITLFFLFFIFKPRVLELHPTITYIIIEPIQIEELNQFCNYYYQDSGFPLNFYRSKKMGSSMEFEFQLIINENNNFHIQDLKSIFSKYFEKKILSANSVKQYLTAECSVDIKNKIITIHQFSQEGALIPSPLRISSLSQGIENLIIINTFQGLSPTEMLLTAPMQIPIEGTLPKASLLGSELCLSINYKEQYYYFRVVSVK